MLFAVTSLFAKDAPAPEAVVTDVHQDRAMNASLPVCSAAAQVLHVVMKHKLPANLTGSVVQTASERSWCDAQFAQISSREGGYYLGVPWFLEDFSGTSEEKLKAYAWKNLQDTMVATIDHTKTRDGLNHVTLFETTEHGKVPIHGDIDPAGTIFFLGHFYPIDSDIRAERLKNFAPMLANAPTEGASAPQVTVIEFSDFQCPACMHASTYLDSIMAKHGSQVRYIRYDLPLMSHHPWAFSAAVAGRAIYRQKPELFWEFKKQIYANQDKISNFTVDEFTRGFAQDHELDLKKYDADVASAEVQNQILEGIGMAFSTDIRATPTYLVNGAIVDPGDNGKALEAYVEKQLK